MVKSCVAYNCSERCKKPSRTKFHRFPTNPKMQQRWALALRRDNFVPKYYTYVCNKHFKEDDYYITSTGSTRIKPDAVPSVFDFSSCRTKRKTKQRRSSESRDGSALPEPQSANTLQNPSVEELETVQEATSDGTVSAESLLTSILQNPSVKLVSVEDESTDGYTSSESQSEAFLQYPPFLKLELAEDGLNDGDKSTESHGIPTPQNGSLRFGQDALEQLNKLLLTKVKRRRPPIAFGDFVEEDLDCPIRRHRYWRVTQETVKKYRAKITKLSRDNQYLRSKIKKTNGLVNGNIGTSLTPDSCSIVKLEPDNIDG